MHKKYQTFAQKLPSTRMIILVELVALLFLILGYLYLVNEAVLVVVERKSTLARIESLTTSISEMEFQYISQSSDIDLELARSKGFFEVDDPRFAEREHHPTLSMRESEN